MLSWVNDAHQLYLLLTSRSEEIHDVEAALYERYSPLKPEEKKLADFEKGSICVARWGRIFRVFLFFGDQI